MPLSWPLLENENPDGNEPEATDQEYGVVPPLAPITYEYEEPDCAPGIEPVVIVNGVVGALAGFTVTLALALFVESAELVAVTVTIVFVVTEGALNIPVPEIVPALEDHVTDVLLVPWTVATNCWPAPAVRLGDNGETEILTVVIAGVTLTTALALLLLFATLVARTVTFVVVVTVGAMNSPALEMLPAEVDHVTPVLLVPWTVAENCLLPPELKLAPVGETEMLTVVVTGVTLTTALALLLLLATLVARTVTFVAEVTFGATNSPALEMLPAEADHVTAVLLTP